MGNYDRGSNDRGGSRGGYAPRGRSSFGGGDRGGYAPRGRSSFGNDRGNDRGPREMFKAVCDNCGKDCEVPFRPTNGKPVYCSDCFEKMGGRDSRDSGPRGGDRNDRPQFRAPSAPTQDFSELNSKLDRIISLLESKSEKTVVSEPVKVETTEKKAPKAKKAKEEVSEE